MTLKEELNSEQVIHLDLSGFCEVDSGTSISETLAEFRRQGHNVCLVKKEGKLVGIVTDRDVSRRIVGGQLPLNSPVDEVMTPDPITIPPQMSAADAIWLMDRKMVRNLPVVRETGEIAGTMTYQAIIRYLANRYPTIVLNLPPRPGHYATKAEGGD